MPGGNQQSKGGGTGGVKKSGGKGHSAEKKARKRNKLAATRTAEQKKVQRLAVRAGGPAGKLVKEIMERDERIALFWTRFANAEEVMKNGSLEDQQELARIQEEINLAKDDTESEQSDGEEEMLDEEGSDAEQEELEEGGKGKAQADLEAQELALTLRQRKEEHTIAMRARMASKMTYTESDFTGVEFKGNFAVVPMYKGIDLSARFTSLAQVLQPDGNTQLVDSEERYALLLEQQHHAEVEERGLDLSAKTGYYKERSDILLENIIFGNPDPCLVLRLDADAVTRATSARADATTEDHDKAKQRALELKREAIDEGWPVFPSKIEETDTLKYAAQLISARERDVLRWEVLQHRMWCLAAAEELSTILHPDMPAQEQWAILHHIDIFLD